MNRSADQLNDAGVDAYAQGRLADASRLFVEAIGQQPRHVQALANLTLVMRDMGRSDAAIEAARRAIDIDPTQAALHNNLGLALEDEGRVDEAIAAYRAALQRENGNHAIHSNLLLALNYDPKQTPASLLAEHRAWAQRHIAATPRDDHANVPDPDRRLRVGYLSPDFRSHPAVYFFEPILQHHDREQYEVFGYANVANTDHITQRMASRCDQYRNVSALNDAQLAERIAADGIDILIDMAGHTAHSRLPALASKPAPVQISYLGYQNSTGMAAVDYRITDPICDPPDAATHYVEKPLHVDGCFLCFNPSPTAPDITPLPAKRNGFVTFAAHHRLVKVNDAVIATWCEVMRCVEGSRMVIFPRSLSQAAMNRLTAAFAQHGIAPERLTFEHKQLTGRPYLSVFADVDLAMDVFPNCAGTTACEALWMGVPLVAMRGEDFRGRMSASILAAAGLPQFVADRATFVQRAAELAEDVEQLASLRAAMRERLAASMLCDGAGFARRLEGTYRRAWRGWCAAAGG